MTFDGTAKTITVPPGTVNIDVRADLYSAWKDWAASDDNLKFEAAFRTFGGDPTQAGQFAPSYFFLANGWRVVVNGLELAVSGNLYTDAGESPFIVTNSAITHKTSDVATISGGSGSVDLTPVTTSLNQLKTITTEINHNNPPPSP